MAGSRKTINVKGIEVAELSCVRNGKAVLELQGPKHKIRLHIEREDISYLSRYLWDFVKAEEKQIAEARRALRGEDQ